MSHSRFSSAPQSGTACLAAMQSASASVRQSPTPRASFAAASDASHESGAMSITCVSERSVVPIAIEAHSARRGMEPYRSVICGQCFRISSQSPEMAA